MIDLFFLNESMVKVLERLRMFTNISNIIVFVVVGLYLLNIHQKKWYKYLAVIGLVAILMTGIIYHGCIDQRIFKHSFKYLEVNLKNSSHNVETVQNYLLNRRISWFGMGV